MKEQLYNVRGTDKEESVIEELNGMAKILDLEAEFQGKLKEYNLSEAEVVITTKLDRRVFADECIKAGVSINFSDLVEYPIF